VFVVSCDRGRLLFVSESVASVLGYQRNELLGQSWFDLLHPKDIQKMKEQLASSDLSPRERYIDSKTMLPVKTGLGSSHRSQNSEGLCPGARRAFFCRMRAKEGEDKMSRHQKKFNVVRCIGYLKSWTPLDDEEGAGGNLSCLVAVGRAMPAASPSHLPPPLRADVPTTSISSFQLLQQHNAQTGLSFSSRHSVDGKYVYVDPGVTYIFGYLPQEIVGLNLPDFYHPDDAVALADIHRRALTHAGGVMSPTYRFKTKEGSYQVLQTHFKAFRNPWTKETEFIVARNFIPFRGGELYISVYLRLGFYFSVVKL
jgi:aryl hydrocarbon receptor nuclear translocator-like protein 1